MLINGHLKRIRRLTQISINLKMLEPRRHDFHQFVSLEHMRNPPR
jgi:hypothetical protein